MRHINTVSHEPVCCRRIRDSLARCRIINFTSVPGVRGISMPVVAHLASEPSGSLTARVVGAGGYDASLWSNPGPFDRLRRSAPGI